MIYYLLTNIEDPPRPWDSIMVSKEWNTSFRYMRERLTDTIEGRSTHRVSIRVWTVNAETRPRSQEGSEREGMVGERDSRGFSDLISQEWKLRCRIGIQVRVMKSCHQCSLQQDTLFRVRIQENKNWVFVCQDCLKIVKPDNPHYQYGGTWKNRKKK